MSPRRTKMTDFKPLQSEVLKLRAENERLRAALNALVIVNGREIGYRTMYNIPMAMTKRIEKKVRAALPRRGRND